MLLPKESDNPFSEWEDLRRDSPLPTPWAVWVFPCLALLAATLHFLPWMKLLLKTTMVMGQPWKTTMTTTSPPPQQRGWHSQDDYQNKHSSLVNTTTNPEGNIYWSMLFWDYSKKAVSTFVTVGIPFMIVYGIPWMVVVGQNSASTSSSSPPSPPLLAWTLYITIFCIAVLHTLDTGCAYYVLFVMNTHNNTHKPQRCGTDVSTHVQRLGLLLAFLGALCLGSSATEMAHLNAKIQYVGPVRLTNIAMYYHDTGSMNDNSPSHQMSTDAELDFPYVYASWTAEWGSSWACPHMSHNKNEQPHWCTVRQTACHSIACHHTTCPDSAIDFSRAMTRECLNMISLHWMDAAATSASDGGSTTKQKPTHTFDRNISPRQDGLHWPTMVAYANCETCEIYGGTRVGYDNDVVHELLSNLPQAKQQNRIGVPLLILGWSMTVLTVLWNLSSYQRSGFSLIPNVVSAVSGDGVLGTGTTSIGITDNFDHGDLELEVVPSVSGGMVGGTTSVTASA